MTGLLVGTANISAISAGLASVNSGLITVIPGAANHLSFGTQPTNTVAGQSITPAVTVQVLDAHGNLCTGNTSSITIAIKDNPSGGILSGDNPKNAIGGVATFGNLSIDKPGNAYTLKATGLGLIEGDSNAFNITPSGPVTNATWTGAISTEWNNPANWSGGSVPSDITAVIIPLTINQPITSNAVTIGSLTIYSGAILTTRDNAFTVKSNIALNGAINTGASTVTINGNLTSTSGGTIQGTNPTLSVDGFMGTTADPINTSVTGTLTIHAGGMQNLTSIAINGTGNYSYQEDIPGFVFANGSLVSYAGQTEFRSSLETGESVLYRGLAMPQPLMAPSAIAAPVSIAVMTPVGPIPAVIAPVPAAPVLPVVPMPQPTLTPALSTKLLFKEANVTATVLELSTPQTFRNITSYANSPDFMHFRDVSITSSMSRMIAPNIFSDVKIILQIR